MELSIRDWLLIIGILLLMAVALDGLRRARKERQNQVRLSKNAKRAARKGLDDELFNSELPNGGGRTLSSNETDNTGEEAPAAEPEITTTAVPKKPTEHLTEEEAVDPLFVDPFTVSKSEPVVDDELPSIKTDNKVESKVESKPQKIKAAPKDDIVIEDEESEPEELIVLHVVAGSEPFAGDALHKILTACDCRLSKHNIYNRFERENGQGKVQFSIVNMVEPGTFDVDASFTTKGVSFFLQLPGAEDPADAYKCMVEIAQVLVRNMGGSLKDEAHSTVTEQTLEHGRQRIRDFRKRKLLQN